MNRPTVSDAATGATSPGEGSAIEADRASERERTRTAHGDLKRGRPSERSAVVLSFWECGHIEVDDGSTHECDGRDVCVAKWHKYVPAEDDLERGRPEHLIVEQLRSMADDLEAVGEVPKVVVIDSWVLALRWAAEELARGDRDYIAALNREVMVLSADNERLREALAEAVEAARLFNRDGMTWLEYDRELVRLEGIADDLKRGRSTATEVAR